MPAARCALAMQPAEPWAQHALAHVMLTDGRLAEGAAFLQQASGQWTGLTSFMRGHNWWHLALFRIELGDDAAALRLYDEQVWGLDKSYSQDQVDAVSLLARLELAGVAVGERWDELAGHLAAVQNLLQAQANAQRQSERLRRRLHAVYSALRLPARAAH